MKTERSLLRSDISSISLLICISCSFRRRQQAQLYRRFQLLLSHRTRRGLPCFLQGCAFKPAFLQRLFMHYSGTRSQLSRGGRDCDTGDIRGHVYMIAINVILFVHIKFGFKRQLLRWHKCCAHIALKCQLKAFTVCGLRKLARKSRRARRRSSGSSRG